MTVTARPSTRPQPEEPREYHFPTFERLALPNGLRVVMAYVPKLPVVTALVLIDAGAVADPVGLEGLAQLTAQMLSEGTTRSEGAELTERFEQLGTSVDTDADWDAATARLTVVSERFPQALSLLGEVLMSPGFAVRDIERRKGERLAELLQRRAEPRGLADDMFSKFVYDSSSRYTAPEGGMEESVSGLSESDVRKFYDLRYRPSAITLILVGDLDRNVTLRLVEATFGGWTGSVSASSPVSDAAARSSTAVHIVAKEEAPQSELRIGHVGIPRTHPDYFPVVVMNAVLGGLFSSRINLNLREEHAYTYGAFSAYEWRRGAGPFVVSTAVKSDVTDAAVREVLREIDRMRSEEITESELTLATSYLDGVFPIRYETTAAIAGALSNLVLFGLPADYFDRYRANIRNVTTGDVLRAAREHLHPDRIQVLAVGDPTVIREPLNRLGIGPVGTYASQGKAIG